MLANIGSMPAAPVSIYPPLRMKNLWLYKPGKGKGYGGDNYDDDLPPYPYAYDEDDYSHDDDYYGGGKGKGGGSPSRNNGHYHNDFMHTIARMDAKGMKSLKSGYGDHYQADSNYYRVDQLADNATNWSRQLRSYKNSFL